MLIRDTERPRSIFSFPSLADVLGLLACELGGRELRLCEDQHGNYVAQKLLQEAISLVPGLVDAITTHAERLSLHNYGCRIIQRTLENVGGDPVRRDALLDAILLADKVCHCYVGA